MDFMLLIFFPIVSFMRLTFVSMFSINSSVACRLVWNPEQAQARRTAAVTNSVPSVFPFMAASTGEAPDTIAIDSKNEVLMRKYPVAFAGRRFSGCLYDSSLQSAASACILFQRFIPLISLSGMSGGPIDIISLEDLR
jgi:hypothetical protein